MVRTIVFVPLLAVIVFLAGCSGPPLKDDSGDDYEPAKSQRYHQVAPGESLWSIASHYRLNYQDLATWNHIPKPYRIYPQQVLRLSADPSAIQEYQVRAGDTLYTIAFDNDLDYKQLAGWNRISAPYTIYPGQYLSLKPITISEQQGVTVPHKTPPQPDLERVKEESKEESPAEETVSESAAQESKPEVETKPERGDSSQPGPQTQDEPADQSNWLWPATGQVVATYIANKPGRKGVDIAGVPGDPVYATKDGKVVYSGSGLIGYGRLIIIKHDERYLSAYGHNQRLLVKEGEQVKQGQKIALMGRDSTGQPRLHFEIRSKGQPVDPLKFLPTSQF